MSNMIQEVSAALLKTAIFNASILPSDTPGVDYYTEMLTKLLPGGSGATFEKSFLRTFSNDIDDQFAALEDRLVSGEWMPYEAPNLSKGAIALRMEATWCGRIGVIPLSDEDIHDWMLLRVVGAGKLSVAFDYSRDLLGAVQDHITAIICEKYGGWVLDKVIPGDPIPESTVTESSGLKSGDLITVSKARGYGFKYAKLNA